MSFKAVLFDFDGVVVDTEGIYTDFWKDIDRLYPTGVPDFSLAIKGNTLINILNRYFRPELHDDITGRVARLERTMTIPMYDGVARLLRSLRAAGKGIAIATASNPAKMRKAFADLPVLAETVDVLVSDRDVTESKPSPQCYLIAASRLGVDPCDCVVVEDSLAGLRAGRSAGGKVAGVATTNPREAVEPLADIVVDRPGELSVGIFESLFR